MTKRLHDLRAGILLFAILLATWWALAPGRAGTFHFDDYWTLRELVEINDDPSLDRHAEYVITGISSSLGRPLTLATFAVQHASWSRNPGDFIRVNILLHLLNGALLFWCLLRLAALAPRWSNPYIPLSVTALWLLAPLHAGAVLYIVQRMAVFAGTFMLLGWLLYLGGRLDALGGNLRRGYLRMSLGLGAGTAIGVLAKENAALFPIMIALSEWTLLRQTPRPLHWRPWAAVFLAFPATLLFGYIVLKWPDWVQLADKQGYTPGQRVVSESRVLFMYLKKLFLPSLYNIRLLYDDLALSRSLIDPPITAVAAGAWVLLTGLAVHLRRHAPLFSFGVLWFLACHLLESTVLPLELAFDHRNYVAAIGPLLALCGYVADLLRMPRAARLRGLLTAVAIAYVAFFAVASWHTARLWGRPLELWVYWAHNQPDSKRARHDVADAYLRNGRADEAARIYEEAWDRWPGDPAFAVAHLELGCYLPELRMPDAARLRRTAEHFDGHVVTTLSRIHRLVALMEDGKCARHSAASLHAMLEPILLAPDFERQEQNVLLILSRLARLEGQVDKAITLLEQAFAVKPRLNLAIQAAYWSLNAGMPERAQRHIDWALGPGSSSPIQRWANQRELLKLQERVRAAQPDAGPLE